MENMEDYNVLTVTLLQRCAIGLFLAAMALPLWSAPSVAKQTPATVIGVNPEAVSDYGSALPFIDLMKLSRGWLTQCNPYQDPFCQSGDFVEPRGSSWDTREQHKLDLDADGWIRSLPDPATGSATATNYTRVSALIPTGLSEYQPQGRFLVLYDGEGIIEYELPGALDQAASVPGRHVLDLIHDPGKDRILLTIAKTDPFNSGDYIRNIRVMADGGVCSNDPARYCEAPDGCDAGGVCRSFETVQQTQNFDPRYLENIRHFATIRTMDLQNTNTSLLEYWADRSTPRQVRWTDKTGGGVPVEVLVELVNTTGADLWVNIPYRAADDYVTRMATLIRDTLDVDLRVYVEYANEVWNGAFAAGNWMEQQGLARWPGASASGFTKRLNWYGMRSAEICEIWETVWAGETQRVSCVVAAQAANPWTARQTLECPLWAAENGGLACYRRHVDILAIAPYFGAYIGHARHLSTLEQWVQDTDGGLARLFDEIFNGGEFDDSPPGGALARARQEFEDNLNEALLRGLTLAAYEGGQHLVGQGAVLNNPRITALFIAANRDPRMGKAYRQYLKNWRKTAGGLLNLWTDAGPYSQWGSWGLLEHRDQPTSRKYEAVVDFIDKLPRR